jgi:hypothetical protein
MKRSGSFDEEKGGKGMASNNGSLYLQRRLLHLSFPFIMVPCARLAWEEEDRAGEQESIELPSHERPSHNAPIAEDSVARV